MRLGDVVRQVQRGFGDRQIVSASVAGSVLSVRSAAQSHGDGASQMKAVFEGWVLGHAVADWMRLRGKAPISSVKVLGSGGKPLEGYGTIPVATDTSVSQLPKDACRSAAGPLARGLLALVTARTLPYVRGSCVFVVKAAKPAAGTVAAADALPRMIGAIGLSNQRPYFFEVVSSRRVPLSSAAWMVEGGGATYARPGCDYVLAPAAPLGPSPKGRC